MRIPFTKYGLPQVLIAPLIALVFVAIATFFAIAGDYPIISTFLWICVFLGLIVFGWILSFFRDPLRIIPEGKNLLLSPADGTIADIELLQSSPIGTDVYRIGIFLSVFNVHINRVPCDVRIDKITYREGQFKDARSPVASQVNESNDIEMTSLSEVGGKLLVRQISGAIARRIVCRAEAGQTFLAGQQFGMIKFGSRTELYVPNHNNLQLLVKIGDKVNAGSIVLAQYI